MASTSSSTLTISTLFDGKAPRHSLAFSPQCVRLPTLHPSLVQSQNLPLKTTTYCRKNARNVTAMATGDAPADVATTESLEIVKPLQEAWEKVEDKYAVSSLAVAGVVALWGSTGLISAIDRLPLIPGVFEVVGIGYTGWFVYNNLVFKPDREALVEKIKETYSEIIGSS
ncbi:hypothetical protein TanjilG_23167 [Lupinus angustifolius]|uniref:Cyanobacterial aminoacyl-tRNA synthetase CAAD domain-containing protein n=1 Tax=Lupinus angustifolius TaxID=3871 RepID=A0A394DKV5_LUPAN|nr:PREDICTED: protein CURVATURE THYLAKOID 1B, chloroplastic-like [Lupinus angustifolius]OIW20787.1 hypothetical protein TanjilG_23167 [Lupinus angustifolius]